MISRTRLFLPLLTACVATLTSASHAQPRKKSQPVTQADLDRLERKVDEQRRLFEKLVQLQLQSVQSMNAALTGGAPAATTPAPGTPVATNPATPAEPGPAGATKDPAATTGPKRVKPAAPAVPVVAEVGAVGTVVGKIEGGADAIVYVEDIVSSAKGSAAMKQEGKQFVPQVLVVQKGTTVAFPNRDAIFHNVFSVTPDHTFDLGSYRQGDSKSVTMVKPGVLTVYCNMHPQMIGHILVVPNGNYVRAGKDGFFRLPNVPAGKHKIVAWTPTAKPVTVAAMVTSGEVTTVELALKRGKAAPHVKKDGMPYGSYEQ